MDEFLSLIEASPNFQLGCAPLAHRVGFECAATLRQCSVLVHKGRFIDQIPCGLHGSFGACSRFLRTRRNESFAVCESRARTCPKTIEPHYRDLKAWELDQEVFAATIRHLLGLQASLECLDWLQQPLWRLGFRHQQQSCERFFLLLQPHYLGFSMLVALLSNLLEDCWLLVPTWHRISPEMRNNYSVHSAVSICALTDLLGVQNGAIFLKHPPLKAGKRLFSKVSDEIPALCALYTHDKPPQLLNFAEYKIFCETITNYQLVIDLQKLSVTSASPCARGLPKGKPSEAHLTHSEAEALAYLMRHRRPMSVHEILPTRHLAQPIQLIERGRRKLDNPINANRWHFFQTLSERSRFGRGFHFDPEPDTRWALVIPYKMIADEIASSSHGAAFSRLCV